VDFGTPTTKTMRKDVNKSKKGIKAATNARERRRKRTSIC
jgi:hypothetical protein